MESYNELSQLMIRISKRIIKPIVVYRESSVTKSITPQTTITIAYAKDIIDIIFIVILLKFSFQNKISITVHIRPKIGAKIWSASLSLTHAMICKTHTMIVIGHVFKT